MSRTLILVFLLSACTSSQPAAESAENEPVADAPAPTPTPTAETPSGQTATPESTSTPSPKPVPPLSSPNPTPAPAPAGGNDAGAATGDPRTEALRRVGVIGQRCHEKNTPGVNGNLVLNIVLVSDGSIKKASVIKARSTAALVGGALERCVLDGVKKEKFPPLPGEETTLDVPLSFKPGT
jgi:outer membrane biosynthesis protein TonB